MEKLGGKHNFQLKDYVITLQLQFKCYIYSYSYSYSCNIKARSHRPKATKKAKIFFDFLLISFTFLRLSLDVNRPLLL